MGCVLATRVAALSRWSSMSAASPPSVPTAHTPIQPALLVLTHAKTLPELAVA
jgi:hypothetical protein